MRWLVLGLCAGCGTDLFALPYDKKDLGPVHIDFGGGGDLEGASDGGGALDLWGTDLYGADLPASTLPAACAQVACTPAMNEGDVDLQSGDISGCHAYDHLTISGVVQVAKSDGQGFVACANQIVLGIELSADGRGYNDGNGPGVGGSCGSGGGHGGKGGDATGCSGGGAYDDPNLPRQPGSGGGSLGGGGGNGGGAVELVADEVQVIGFITAGGQQATGLAAGGGGGGSVIIRAGKLLGTGQVRAAGGGGLGLGGGGGGGRIAVYATTNAASLTYDVGGGDSMSGNPGAAGTVISP